MSQNLQKHYQKYQLNFFQEMFLETCMQYEYLLGWL